MTDLWRVLKLARPYWLWMVLAALVSSAATLANIGLMATSGWFIAAMGLAGATGAAINYFTPAALIRAFAIIRTGGRYLERLVSHEATLRIVAGLRTWLYARFEPLAPAGLQHLRSGDVLARMGADIDRLEHAFLRLFVPAAVAMVTVLVVVGVATLYLPLFGLVLLALLACAGLALPAIAYRLGRDAGARHTADTARMSVLLVDSLEGLGELKAYGLDAAQNARIAGLSDELIANETRLADIGALARAGIGIIANMAMWGALALAGAAAAAGAFAPADLAMLALLALASFEALAPIPDALQSLSATLASARRIFALADAEPAPPEPAEPRPLPDGNCLVFENVALTYPGARAPALDGIDLDLAPGRHVGIVGPSGSGKSSLAALVLKFWAPTGGRITLGGVPLAEIDGEDLRRRIAVVPQRAHLFAETIAENLRRAAPGADDDTLRAACRIAQVDAFIMAQPDGYATEVGAHGLKLSGGQARRLSVAQALLRRAPILILDEPGEGIDIDTEKALLHAVLDARADAAVLYITHRRQALDRMHEVVVVGNGRVVKRGRPEDVLG
ncbi:MAG: thiol reductant ABC exporter subunit CydC [Alphaproteobacteria bacterium]|nr:thiol reductant ABC exporter subunit CydC [Alphaproteobacteria bacterium]